MISVNVDRETADAIRSSDDLVPVRDEQGQCIGYVMPPWTDEERKEIQERLDSDGPWHTTAEVLEHLKSLEP